MGMIRKSRAPRSPAFMFAAALVALAGWVDAVAFVRLARTYVSFMSGNSTSLAAALGIQNGSIHEAGGVPVALTYVTGTLVRFGRTIAAALAGRGSWRAGLPFLLLWPGMMAGAAAIAIAAVAALVSATLVARLRGSNFD